MAKFYKRQDPSDDLLRRQADLVKETVALPENRVPLVNEFGAYTLHTLSNGDVELAAEDGQLFRLYVVLDEDGHRLIVDDYHPDEDADVKVDAGGQILEPFDDPEVP